MKVYLTYFLPRMPYSLDPIEIGAVFSNKEKALEYIQKWGNPRYNYIEEREVDSIKGE